MHEFAIFTSSQDNSRCQNFHDRNPNSYDNLHNMKLDLNVAPTQVRFRANNQAFSVKIRIITGFFEEFRSESFKGHSTAHL